MWVGAFFVENDPDLALTISEEGSLKRNLRFGRYRSEQEYLERNPSLAMEPTCSSHQESQLERVEQFLQEGEAVEVRIVGAWIAGIIARDASGWYLITGQHVSIRLQAGLVVRSSCASSPPRLSSSVD